MGAGQREHLVVFERPTVTEDELGQETEGVPTEIAQAYAQVRYGTAQEKREAAQEAGVQSATFICDPSTELATVTLKDRIRHDAVAWDITEIAPLDRMTIRFTGIRTR